VVTGRAAGNATITASSGGRTGSVLMTVTSSVATVRLSTRSVTLDAIGAQATLTAAVIDAFGNPIPGAVATFTSVNPAVASVTSAGVVTAVKVGTTQIIASASGGADTAMVTVRQVPASVVPSVGSATLLVGGTLSMTATVYDAKGVVIPGAPLTWSSTAPGVATVSGGLVTAVATGTTTIRITSGTVSGESVITVTSAPQGSTAITAVTIQPKVDSFNALGVARQYSATAVDGTQPVAGATFTWSSLEPHVASVSASGMVTSVGNGTARIVAASGGKADTATVVVSQEVARAEITPLAPRVAVGASIELRFTLYDANNQAVPGHTPTWSSAAPQNATVNSSGVLLAKKVSSVQITAKAGIYTASTTVTIEAASAKEPATVTITPSSAALAVGDSVLATATVRDVDGKMVTGATVTWSSSNAGVALVNASGLIRALAVGTAVITATSGSAAGTLNVAVSTSAPTITSVVASPERDTIRAISFTRQLSAVAKNSEGGTVDGTAIGWTSLHPTVATVTNEGNVTAKSLGMAMIVASAMACSGCAADTVSMFVMQEPAVVELSQYTVALNVSGSQQIGAVVKDAAGYGIQGASVSWSAYPAGIVSVSSTGVVSALTTGTATVAASSGDKKAEAGVTVAPTVAPTTTTTNSAGAAFIIGPQVPLGQSPWSFFDTNMAGKAKQHRDYALAAFAGSDGDAALNSQYYDLALVLYTLHARSDDPVHLQYARDVAAGWWARMPHNVAWSGEPFQVAPRNVSFGGLLIHALEGAGQAPLTFKDNSSTKQFTLWQWLTGYAQEQYKTWLGRSISSPNLWFGVRDGAFTLQAVTWLAQVHPDAAVRDDMRAKSLTAARDYYARLQQADGGWYWDIDDGKGAVTSQPFMIGMLMEALIAVHQLTGDPKVAEAIVRGVDFMWEKGYEQQPTSNLPDVRWRAMKYFVYSDGRVDTRTTAFEYGMADGAIRDARQLNPTTVHAFGYAYKLTGNAKYRTQGDEIFAATFGKGQGPGADAYWALADYQAKQYNQSYRSAGKYLAWR
jgi:uncharacterized protein YjdB